MQKETQVLPRTGVKMGPEGYEPLSLADHVLIARINLSCAAFGLIAFALLADWVGWQGRMLALAVSALLVLLARHVEAILRRLDAGGQKTAQDVTIDHYLIPF